MSHEFIIMCNTWLMCYVGCYSATVSWRDGLKKPPVRCYLLLLLRCFLPQLSTLFTYLQYLIGLGHIHYSSHMLADVYWSIRVCLYWISKSRRIITLYWLLHDISFSRRMNKSKCDSCTSLLVSATNIPSHYMLVSCSKHWWVIGGPDYLNPINTIVSSGETYEFHYL